MFKVLVCGGREYQKKLFVHEFLDELKTKQEAALNPITHIIHGGAQGVDDFAGLWGDRRGICVVTVYAQWTFYGNRAGPIRNKRMLQLRPSLVVAFPGGTGTKHMMQIAAEQQFPVIKAGW